MERIIENLKATVESTGQIVTGRLIFTQVIVQTQIVQPLAKFNREMYKMAWIPRFECNEPLEIMDDKVYKGSCSEDWLLVQCLCRLQDADRGGRDRRTTRIC